MVEALTILACCCKKDASLRNGRPDQKFDHLKNPESFKASLYQCINAMREVFRTGHNSMYKMKLSLTSMPTYMNDVLDLLNDVQFVKSFILIFELFQLGDPDCKEILDGSLESIKNCLDQCVLYANEAHTECIQAMNVITELTNSAIATQSRNEEEEDRVKKEIEEKQALQEQRKKQLKELEDLEAEQTKVVKEAMEEYKVINLITSFQNN